MGISPHLRRVVLPLACALLSAPPLARAQGSTSLTEPSVSLLPESFGGWTKSASPAGPAVASPAPGLSLSAVSQAALEECGPQRSQVADYTHDGRTIHIEAVQFGDRSGAYSAYTLVKRADMREGKDLGSWDSVGAGSVLFQQGTSLVLAGPATAADVANLKPLAAVLPKVSGNKGVAPLLPVFLPERGVVPGSARYALGPATYAAEGGVLPANALAWNKSAEAVTAKLADKRGAETLTLLLYPTPQIAAALARSLGETAGHLGPSFASAKIRREGELVMLASGSFSPDEAQRVVENIHMRQELSIDKDVQPVFHTEVMKTYSLLSNIAVLSGVMMAAAVLLGLFLGGGRALLRVMRGKSAAVEPEFLSLHLAAENATPLFEASRDKRP